MITKADVLKMIKNVRRRSRGLPDRRLIHPQRDWGVLLAVFLVGATVSVLYSGYTYVAYNSLNDTIAAESSQVTRYDATAVAQALELYAVKSTAFGSITDVPVIQAPEAPATTTPETEASVVEVGEEVDDAGVPDETVPPSEEEAVPLSGAPELSF